MTTPKAIATSNFVLTPTAPDNQHLVNQLNTQVNALATSIQPALNSTYTVGQLNALTGMTQGQTAYVSNGDPTVGWGIAVGATTGAIHLRVHYTGTTWRYG